MRIFKYIGSVAAKTDYYFRGEFEESTYGRWLLYEGPFRWRFLKKVGCPGDSLLAQSVECDVKRWKAGGPLPRLDKDD